MKPGKMKIIFVTAISFLFSFGLHAQWLYVGANYHPHDDKNFEKIKSDIQLMKAAGFTCVRMGHLAWDSYEPAEGKFDFAWFDKVMDEMNKAGIKVIRAVFFLIRITPAILQLHLMNQSLLKSSNKNISI